jgi:hypothetical protein
MAEHEPLRLEYEIEPGQGANFKAEAQKIADGLFARLATDPGMQKLAKEHGIDLKEFERLRDQVNADPSLKSSSLIKIEPERQGIDPASVTLFLVTIAPPIFKGVVAPVAVYICKSVWDNFILPDLRARFGKVEQKKRK